MDGLPHGIRYVKDLLRMSWRSLIIGAVAESYQFFTPGFFERSGVLFSVSLCISSRRQKRLTSRQGLYAVLFDAFPRNI